MHTNAQLSALIISIVTLFLSACGGGGSTVINNGIDNSANNSNSNVQVTSNLPQIISSKNWQSTRILSPANKTDLNLDVVGSQLLINIKSENLSKGDHVQVYLNTDNKAETGFQFEGEAWAQSGVDYIIEDGDLFKSTANDTNWSWNTDAGQISYAVSIDSVHINIDLSLLGDICNSLNIGVMTRDDDWDIATFYPASTHMKNYAVSYCNTSIDIEPPVITLNGANPITLSLNSVFNDPGASATDNIDGDISANIIATSNVNTAIAGNYTVSYQVSDIAGNTITIIRDVIITDDDVQEGIVVDGNSADWSSIPTFASDSNGIMKVSDDADKLYILITSTNLGENTQIFIDNDNSKGSGLVLELIIDPWEVGIDYMIENNSLAKYSGSSIPWAWAFGIAPIEFSKTTDTLELAIKKSDFDFLGNNLPMGFVSQDENWNLNYILPNQQMPVYSLQFPSAPNPVNANNDNATTLREQSITIDVLSNDIAVGNEPLKITSIAQGSLNGYPLIVDNKILYKPAFRFVGTDTFSYEITNQNGDKDSATVTVIITDPTPANNPPVAVNDSVSTIGTQAVAISVLDNDSDPDNDSLTVTGITSQTSNGTVTSISNGQFSYAANAGFSGTDSFTYAISDGNGGTDTAIVTITISPTPNNSPDAVEDVADVDFDKTVTVNVLANDTDPDGDTLTVQSIVQPTVGTATLNADGTIFFNPQNNVGSVSISYTISDGRGGTDTAVLTIASTDPNDGNDAFPDITNENVSTPINTAIFIDVLANDTDADGDVLVLDQVDQGENGTTVKVNGGVLYTPNPGFTGTDIFFYGVHDGHGHNGSGSVTITVTP